MMIFSKRKAFLLIYSVLLFQGSYAQYVPELPQTIQPSPQSRAFTRYGDYPMTGNTGLVDITVPIYELKTKELNLPISMSFHASGRMAAETNGILGMRWTLNCGGVVTRNMKARPDEWERLNPFIADPNTTPSFETLYNSCIDGYNIYDRNHNNTFDSEYDIFNYVLPNGKQGRFILKNENGIKVPMLIPYSPLKIKVIQDASYYGYFKRIEITDTDGTRYEYGGNSVGNDEHIEFKVDNPQDGMIGNIPTAWYLNKIVSSNEKDEITFTYVRKKTEEVIFNETVHNADRLRDNSLIPDDSPYDPYWGSLSNYLYDIPLLEGSGNTTKSYETPTITSIQFNGGTVLFNYTNTNLYNNKWVLDEIIVNTEGDGPNKIKFNSTLHPQEKQIYYLNSVWFLGKDPILNNKGEKYSFSYYEPAPGPYYNEEIVPGANRRDWWGYYANKVQHTLPFQTVHMLRPSSGGNGSISRNIGYSDSRDADLSSKILGMLRSITFPTGGQTEFLYEGNRYDYRPYYNPPINTATLEGPGLRIKEIISKPILGKNRHKYFKYGDNEDGRGYINEYLRPGPGTNANFETCLEGTIMHYWNWVEYNHSLRPEQAGHRIRDYLSEPYLKFDLSGTPITYDVITEYEEEEGGGLANKTISYYNIKYDLVKTFVLNDYGETLQFQRKFSDPENAWEKSSLLGKNYYKKANGVFTLLKSEEYNYFGFDKEFVWDMPTYRHGTIVIGYMGNGTQTNSELKYAKEKQYHENTCNIYGYGFRKYNTGALKLSEVKIKEYTNQGVIEAKKVYTYEPTYLFPRTEEVTNSNGVIYKSEYTYPFDESGIVYNSMVSKNILEPKIQTKYYKNNEFLKSERTNYYDWGEGILSPLNIETKMGNDPIEHCVVFHGYDNKGNLKSVSKLGGPKVCYIYGYGGIFPIAKIENAEYSIVESLLGGLATINNFRDILVPTDLQVANFLAPLRTDLPGAMVNTYKYNLSQGMTTQTDVKGITTYYEYNSFRRLKSIKDQDGNIIKSYDYHYKPQTN